MIGNLMRGARFMRGLLPVVVLVSLTGLGPVSSAAETVPEKGADLPLPLPLPFPLPIPLPDLELPKLPPLPLPPLPLPFPVMVSQLPLSSPVA